MSKIIVPGVGPKDAKIAFVAEALGADEERASKPFVGIAGEMFDSILNQAGIVRSQCYITNVIKEHPYNNDISKFIKFSSLSDVVKTTAEYKVYENELIEELNGISANIIVCCGQVATYALCRHPRGIVKKHRGSVQLSKTLKGDRKVIPTIHPSAVNRGDYKYKYYIKNDFERALFESTFSELKFPPEKLLISPTCTEYGFLPGIHLIPLCVSFSSESLSSSSLSPDIGAAPPVGSPPAVINPAAPVVC